MDEASGDSEQTDSLLNIYSYDEYKVNETKAKQRASVLWLISKAYENQIPNELREPYYRDHEEQDRLKPQIIHGLSTAALYCSALSNIYADPNYHNLDHHGILQVLMRKGIYVLEPSDSALTETVLVQTAPIRMSAHMAVIDGIMSLYIKEVLIPEKVMEVVSRFSTVSPEHEMPADTEDAAILWINKCCVKLRHRIEEELGTFLSPEDSDYRQVQRTPNVPVIQELADLNDGCCLAAVLSLYCPDYFPWQEISFNEPISLADSLYNIQLIQRFCNDHLPRDICFLTLEDFLYMHHTIRQNMLCLIADLMFLFEIQPAKGVVRPGIREDLEPKVIADVSRRHSHNGRDLIHKSHVFHHNISPIPDLRSSSYGGSSCSLPDMHRTSPRVNGSVSVKERSAERAGSARKHHQRSPTSPTSTLRRTHSVSLPESDQHNLKVYSEPSNPKSSQDEPRSRSDEDEEIASYFANRDHPGQEQETLEPLFPAKVKESKEKNNHDTKVQERGEDGRLRRILRSGSQSDVPAYSSPPKRVGSFSDLSHRSEERKKVDEDYTSGRFIPSSSLSYSKSISTSSGVVADQHSSSQGPRSDESSRLSAGLEDYYNQLGQESSGVSVSGNIKGNVFRNDKLISELEDYLEEKAILESIDPYEQKEYSALKSSEAFHTTSFAQLSKVRENPNPTINIIYMQHEGGRGNLKQNLQQKSKEKNQPSERHTSFAALPNTTTWQQQQMDAGNQKPSESQNDSSADDSKSPIAAQLCNMRLKLEERRRKIEHEKRKMEALWKKQRQKLGKTAFLQAIAKGGSPSSADGIDTTDSTIQVTNGGNALKDQSSVMRQLSFKDIEEDIDTVKRKWLDSQTSPDKLSEENSPSSDSVEGVNMEELQNSIEQFNTSLTDIQADIFRLSQKQAAIQELGNRRTSQNEHESKNFFLHSPPENTQEQKYQHNYPVEEQSPRRAQWGEQVQTQRVNHIFAEQQQQPQMSSQMNVNMSPRRSQWGQPVSRANEPPYMANAPVQWHPSMRPASVEPQMMTGHMGMHQPHYEQRPPSAVPFVEQRGQGFSLHNVPPDNYGYQYPIPRQSQPPVYQNGPMEGMMPQYDYRTYGNMPHNHYDPIPYPGMPYASPPQHQQQPFRLNHDAPVMNERQMQSSHPGAYHIQMQQQQQQMADRDIPLLQQNTPPRDHQAIGTEQFNRRQMIQPTLITSEEKHFQPILHDDFGRSTKPVVEQPPSPPSKPVIGRTFRVSKPKLGSSPPKEPTYSPQIASYEQTTDSKTFASNANEKDRGFYISFDDDQPKKPKPKLRPRMMKAHQQLRANSKEGPPVISDESSTSSGPSSTENQEAPVLPPQRKLSQSSSSNPSGVGFVIGADLVNPDPDAETEMARRKEMIMIMSLRRREEQEAQRISKEQQYAFKREQERMKRDYQERKREEEKMRRQSILEHYLQKKALQELEQQGGGNVPSKEVSNNRTGTLTKSKLRSNSATRPRPKSMHVTSSNDNPNEPSLDQMSRASRLSLAGLDSQDDKDSLFSVGSFSQRTLSPTQSQPHQLPSPTQSVPFSVRHYLPPGLGRHTGPPSDGASDAGSTTSSAFTSEYTGPKLFVKPTAKSNRGIIVNAINTVLAGAVNSDTKKKVLEEINRSDSKHFLILFRNSGCQFRALYSYNPDREEVFKLYGIGPKAVNDSMMDRFYKYNSGAKCFSQVHTKHLTVTIDAFTIQNILWSGKKSAAPPKKDLY